MKSERERLRRVEDPGTSPGVTPVRGEGELLALSIRALGEALARRSDLAHVRDAVERSLVASGAVDSLTLSVRREGRVEALVAWSSSPLPRGEAPGSRARGPARAREGRQAPSRAATRLLRFEGARVGHVFASGPAAAAMLDALAPWLAVAVGASLAREASRDAHARAAKAARERVRAASRLREVLGRHPRPAFEVSLEGLVDPLNDTATRALTQKGEALARALAQATLSEHPRWRSVAAETGEGASFLVLEREAAADAREASARFARALALTPRQAEVLERLVLGASNREIARGMGCADVTVEKHVATLFARSGAPDRARLAIAVLTGEAPSAPRAPAVERSAPPAWQPALEPEPVASAALRLPEDTAAEPPTLIGLLVGRTEVPFASRRRDLASMLAEPRRGSARERVREEVYGRVARAVSHHAALHALVEALARSLRAQLDAEGVQIAVGSPSRLELLLEAPEGVRLRRVLSRGGEDVGALEVFVRAELIERATLTMDLLAPFVAARVGASLDRAAAEEALAAAMGDETTAALLVGATAEARRAARRPAQTVAARASAFAARLRVGARDREVLQLLAQGRSNKEIATSLGVAEVTIEARLTALYRRARVRGRQGLLLGMLTP